MVKNKRHRIDHDAEFKLFVSSQLKFNQENFSNFSLVSQLSERNLKDLAFWIRRIKSHR